MSKKASIRTAYQVTPSSLGQGASVWAYTDTACLRKCCSLKTLWSFNWDCLFSGLSSRNMNGCKKWFSALWVTWGDGSVCNVPVEQAWGPWTICKGEVVHVCNLSTEKEAKRQEGPWGSLVSQSRQSIGSRFSERSCLNTECGEGLRRTPDVGLRSPHAHRDTHIDTSTYTHKHHKQIEIKKCSSNDSNFHSLRACIFFFFKRKSLFWMLMEASGREEGR